jgi:hypothetical protein
MTINPSGNVGIGTASPAAKLDVATGSSLSAIFSNANGISNFNSIELRGGTAGTAVNWQISKDNITANAFELAASTIAGGTTYTTPVLTITSGGNVGIGYAPAAKLAVNGTTLINTNTDNGVDKLQVNGSAIATTLKVNTSGQTTTISNYYAGGAGNNIWIGNGGTSSNSSAQYNVSLGHNALLAVTSGFFNTAIGASALQALTTGSGNMALGFESLPGLTSGTANVGVGPSSLGTASTGSDNTAIGNGSLIFITTTSSNIAIGRDAGRRITGGSNLSTPTQSTFIGNDTRASANGNTNEIVIGYTAEGQGSNTATLGNSSITKTFLRGVTMVNTTTDNTVDELQVNGSISGIGMKQAYVAKTGAYTATNDDYVIDCTSGTFTVTLPASSGRTGRILIIKNSGAGTITVDGNASETIDGAATVTMAVQYGTIQIMSDGTNWKTIAKF